VEEVRRVREQNEELILQVRELREDAQRQNEAVMAQLNVMELNLIELTAPLRVDA